MASRPDLRRHSWLAAGRMLSRQQNCAAPIATAFHDAPRLALAMPSVVIAAQISSINSNLHRK
jgi:hypothetical protein